MAGLLDDITVLDLASVGPAARASGWLADYGARVIKVGPVTADGAERITPPPHAYSGGRGTLRVQLDLKADAGRQTFLRMAERVDVVIESFRPGVVMRLGIGYDDVKSRNPGIVYCSTSGYGQAGARSQWAGHDLNYLAVGGYLANSEPTGTGKPPLPGATVADSAAGGMHAVMAILAALVARSRTGDGAYLDVAVAEGVLSLMALQVDERLATGNVHQPGGAPLGGRFACYDLYPTADGKWLSVAAIETKFWANLCRALGLDHLIERQYDDSVQDEVRAELTAILATQDRDAWVRLLATADTCVAPVLSVAEVAADPVVQQRGAVARARHPQAGEFPQLAPLLAGADRGAAYDVPDQSATDSDVVLPEFGFTTDELKRLLEQGVLA